MELLPQAQNTKVPRGVYIFYERNAKAQNTYIDMKFKIIMGWILLVLGLTYGIYKAEPLLDQFTDNAPAAFLFVLIALLLILAIARILRY